MKIRKHLMFFAPESAAVSMMPAIPSAPEPPATEPDPNDDVVSEDLVPGAPTPEGNESAPAAGGAPATVPATQSFTMDPATLAAALKAAGIGQPAAPAAPATPKVLTPEEKKAMLKELKRFDITPDFLAKFNNIQTQQQAMEEFQDGVVEHMSAIMAAYFGHEKQGILSQISPIQKHLEEQQVRAQFERFNTKYPQLADPALAPIRDAVINSLVNAKQTFPDEAAIHDAVAKGMEAIVKQGNPQFKLSAGSSPANQTNSITPAPRRGGGGGGPAAGGAQLSGVPKAVSLMPKIR